jgi:hypothetical protein
MRRTREAHLPPARVVILGAATTPLNHCDAPRAHPRLVHTVFLECTAGLTPLRIRTDHVGHDDHATLLYFLVSRSNPGATMNPGGSGALGLLDRGSSSNMSGPGSLRVTSGSQLSVTRSSVSWGTGSGLGRARLSAHRTQAILTSPCVEKRSMRPMCLVVLRLRRTTSPAFRASAIGRTPSRADRRSH